MPQRPSFFYDGPLAAQTVVSLDPDTSKHVWQVLRMEPGDNIILTDGKGTTADGSIHSAERHECSVRVGQVSFHDRDGHILHLAVGFTKNNSRNEWLLEKATELGVATIIPLSTARTEKTHVRSDRWLKILQSATLQSQQCYLPVLAEMSTLDSLMQRYKAVPCKLIAHCMAAADKSPLHKMLNPAKETIILIGPEGDFTPDEVNLCTANGFMPVSLGTQRLRTETAAITAAAWFNLIGDGKM